MRTKQEYLSCWGRHRHRLMKYVRAMVFPASCIACGLSGAALCIDCAPGVAERDVVILESAQLHVATLGMYQLALREAILAIKDGRRDVADEVAEMMAHRLGPLLPDTLRAAARNGRLCLVGIPTTAHRRRERGYDGGQFLAEALGLLWGLPALPVLKQIAGDSQRGRGRQARLHAKGRFRLKSMVGLASATILLVDDVITTGSTLADVADMLRRSGIQVAAALAIARVGENAEQVEGRSAKPATPLLVQMYG